MLHGNKDDCLEVNGGLCKREGKVQKKEEGRRKGGKTAGGKNG